MASGPVHTFFSRTTTTTVDYIIGNLTTSTAIVSCIVEEQHPLNTSDHLPIISNLNLSLLTLAPRSSDQNNSLNWNSALRLGCIPQYASLTDEAVAPHHLVHAGPLIRSWLCKIFNAIVNLEAIPSPFKTGVIIPIYKGKGKDPLLPTSYRGITLTSVITKTFEYSILDGMLPILRDRNLPQLTQTAYQHGVSCADATFSCQETISKFIREGDSVYSCFYDLASAFDTVEYPVLLSHLKNSGISGKAW